MFLHLGTPLRFGWVVLAVLSAGALRCIAPELPQADSLQRAKELAWLNNWAGAAEVIERINRSGSQPLDESARLFARAVEIRGNIEALSLPSAAKEVSAMLLSDTARTDPALRLQLLAIEGDIEFQYDLPAAERTWKEVQRLASSLHLSRWVVRATGELGTIAFLNGEVSKAVRLVATAYLKAEMDGDFTAQAKQLTALGEGMAEFGRPADAIRFFDKALALSAAHPDMYFPFTAYLGKARLLLATSQADDGQRMLSAALDEARRDGKRVREARILTALGHNAIRKRDQVEAVQWLKAACDVAAAGGLHRIEAAAGSTLSSVLSGAGDLDQAANYARRSVHAAERAGDNYHLPQRLAALAEIEVRRGALAAAEKTYTQATRLIESLFSDLPKPRDQATLAATMGRVFEGHFDLALNGFHDVSRAFEILESARSRRIADRFRQGQYAQQKDPAMVQQIAALNRRLMTEPDSPGRTRLLQRLWETEWRSLRPTDSGVAAGSVPDVVSLRELQRALKPGELLLEYALGPSRSFVLAISRDRTIPYKLKDRAELEAARTRLLRAIQGRHESNVEARDVYRELLEPVTDVPRVERLIIVPDGALSGVPFDAAIDPQGRRLIETHVISYAPSGTAYYVLSAREEQRPKRVELLGVGGVPYRSIISGDIATPVRAGGLFSPLAPPRFSTLRGSYTEVADIAAAGRWDSRLLMGANATEQALKDLPLSSYDVLHFALHSAIDQEFPDRSGLVLSSDRNQQDDDLLQAREIMGLKLNAALVTLSACDGATGGGGTAGANSLVDAFLTAGARSVVANIWDADDVFTAALMRRFYENLSNGEDKAEALTMAKRQLLRMYGPNAIPLYWAGFRLVGEAHGKFPGETH